MHRIVTFGELLVDLVGRRVSSKDHTHLGQFDAFAGGAPANVAVAVTRLGGSARFAGIVGDDLFGRALRDVMQGENVDTSCLHLSEHFQTWMAIVDIDREGERSFEFLCGPSTVDALAGIAADSSMFDSTSILHFCSNSLINQPFAELTDKIVRSACQRGLLVSFDVNIRHNLWQSGEADRELINSFVRQCNVLKLTRDELEFLERDGDQEDISRLLNDGPQLVLVTDGANSVEATTAMTRFQVKPPATDAVDTTGAGDAFIGAFLYGLSGESDPRDGFTNAKKLRVHLDLACRCGAFTVRSHGAISSLPRAGDVGLDT